MGEKMFMIFPQIQGEERRGEAGIATLFVSLLLSFSLTPPHLLFLHAPHHSTDTHAFNTQAHYTTHKSGYGASLFVCQLSLLNLHIHIQSGLSHCPFHQVTSRLLA